MNVRDLIATAEEHLRAATGLHVSSKIAAGDWQTALIAEAKGIGADCIFVSSGSSINDQDAGQPGMVSATLLNGAPCSVEVVRQEGMTLTLISSSKLPPIYLLVAVRRAADRRQAESGRRFRLRPRNLSSGLL